MRRMVYCLGESAKRQSQKFLMQADSITLIRDARNHRLCVRYVASRLRARFHVQRGLLGWTVQKGLSARSITHDTKRIIDEFCCSFRQGQAPVRHSRLRAHIREHVHQVVVDSAADEMLAGELGRDKMLHDMETLLPNCQILLRDKAHAARRPMSRPWTKLPVLKDLISKFVSRRSSPARMIQNSQEFRQWFKQHVARERRRWIYDCANLRAAKHRFESFTKPLQRICLHMRALLATLVQIANTRDDESSRSAVDFFVGHDATGLGIACNVRRRV